MKRSGSIYKEITNSGMHRIGDHRPQYKSRYVGEITVNRKRYRFRSTSRSNVERWLQDMLIKFPEYSTSRTQQ